MQKNPENGAMKKIIADIYGKEFRLANFSDVNDLDRWLEELKPPWNDLCRGFHKWFLKSRKTTFKSNVIESARNNTNVYRICFTRTVLNLCIFMKRKNFEKRRCQRSYINTSSNF